MGHVKINKWRNHSISRRLVVGETREMAKFKLVVSSSDGKAKTVEVEGARAQPLVGKRIDETIDGSIAGLAGEILLITGGSDKDGFPMRSDVHGGVKKSIVLSESSGFHPVLKGERRRKSVRGNVITDNITQVNLKIIKGKKEERKKKTKKIENSA